TRVAVVNLTDDVMLFAQGAIGNVQFSAVPAAVVRGVILEAACSWREVEVRTLDASPPRARIVTRVVHRGIRREFLGFNRARHAVLEAAILATRTHLLPADQIRAEFARLQVIVDKAAGPDAARALEFARRFARHHGLDLRLHFCLHRSIPPHAGLGSGTQLALAVARAIAELCGLPTDVMSLAHAVDRGRRSGVGTWTFAYGGFVLEGGRAAGDRRAGRAGAGVGRGGRGAELVGARRVRHRGGWERRRGAGGAATGSDTYRRLAI